MHRVPVSGVLLLGLALNFSVQAADVAATLGARPELSRFTAALRASGLDTRLRHGSWAVFAPADSSAALPPPPYRAAQLPALREWLAQHRVPGRVAAGTTGPTAHALAGNRVSLQMIDGHWMAGDAALRGTAVPADNGVIYVLTQPLLPCTP